MAKKDREKTRNDGCCGIFFLKYVLVIFNVIFWLSGVALLGIGLWTYLAKSNYVALLGSGVFTVTTYLFMATGALVIFIGLIGCIGACKENRCMLMTYGFFLMIIFIVESVAGGVAFIYSGTLRLDLTRNFNNTLVNDYYFDQMITDAVDALQQDFKCCGTTSYLDWKYCHWIRNKDLNTRGNKAPDSCCVTPSKHCATRDHPSNIYYKGCINSLENYLKEHLIIIGSIGIGICSLQIFGIIFACCLARQLKIWEYREMQKRVEERQNSHKHTFYTTQPRTESHYDNAFIPNPHYSGDTPFLSNEHYRPDFNADPDWGAPDYRYQPVQMNMTS